MNKKLALSFIQRIEAKRAEEERIWDEMRDDPNFQSNEDRAIREILDNRRFARKSNDQAIADLNAFDLKLNDDGELVDQA